MARVKQLPGAFRHTTQRATPCLGCSQAGKVLNVCVTRVDVLERHVQSSQPPVAADVLPEVRQLQRRAQRVGGPVELLIVVARNPQHETAHRVCRSPAVVEHVVPRLVPVRRDILTKRAEQILEELHRKVARANRLSNREKYLIGRIAGFGLYTRVQPVLPIVQQPQALNGRPTALVGKVIRRARKRIERRHVRAHGGGQQPRRNREILVVRARHPLARSIGGAHRRLIHPPAFRHSRQAGYFTGDFPCGT